MSDAKTSGRSARAVAALFATAALLVPPHPVSGYQLLDAPGFVWHPGFRPVPYWVSNRPDDSLDVQRVVAETRAAFQTWAAPPEIGLDFSYRGLTDARPFDFFDSTNTIGFSTPEHISELQVSSTFLGLTSWLIEAGGGNIVEADILINPAYHWTDAPERGGWDYQSVIVHEGGHFMGLGHSNVGLDADGLLEGSSVMWPYSFGAGKSTGRRLTPDDIAGASQLYPGAGARQGRIEGTVVDGDGVRIRRAHVSAWEPVLNMRVGAWADENGDYSIGGLPPGRYVLRANPIPATHPPTAYFFEVGSVDADFRITVSRAFANVGPNATVRMNIEVAR